MNLKPLAKAYHSAVSAYDTQAVARMIRSDYIQHNPKVPTGSAAFIAMLPKLEQHGSRIENIRMLQDGACIVMHHMWHNAAPFGAEQTAAFHIIRFDDQQLIAEHWNVMTPLSGANPAGRTLLDGARELADFEKTSANKSQISKMIDKFVEAKESTWADLMPEFFAPSLIQHHPLVGDGLAALQSAVVSGALPITYLKKHAIFGEGNFVLGITEGKLDATETAFYDLYRMQKGLIVEHWSVYQTVPREGLANTNTMFNFS